MKDNNENGDGVILLRGALELARRNAKNGELIEYRQNRNAIATAGRAWVLERIRSGGATQTINAMAIGGSTDGATTALSDEQDRKTIGTFTTTGLTSSTPYWLAAASWATDEGNTTLGEVGLFNSAAADGTMLARATFATIDKTSTNTLSISYTLSN